MAMVLILLLAHLALKRNALLYWAMGVHVLNMIAPQLYRPAAVIWFSLSHALGIVVSAVILSVIFFFVVTPIGLWRRVFGSDSLRLKAFKSGRGSVMHDRNQTFTGEHLDQPY